MNKYILVDGDYYCHRTLHGMRIGNEEFTLHSTNQKEQFFGALKNGITSLFECYRETVKNIIFVFDHMSWRKQIAPHKPYYIKDETIPLHYKGNRDALKEDSDIDYEAFSEVKERFSTFLHEYLTVFKDKGFEGDDLLLLISHKIADENPNNIVMIICTDGDVEQTVTKENIIIYRNTKSKEYPNGQIFLHNKMFHRLYNSTPMEKLTGGTAAFDNEIINFINIQWGNTKTLLDRKPGHDIVIAKPLTVGFVKVFAGDKKDNIFPLFRWTSKTGTRNFSPTIKYVEKAMSMSMWELNDKNIHELLSSKDVKTELKTVLLNLKLCCGAKDNPLVLTQEELDTVYNHFAHNMRIMILNKTNIPETLIFDFQQNWEFQKEQVLKSIVVEKLLSIGRSVDVDSSQDIMKTSIPTIL